MSTGQGSVVKPAVRARVRAGVEPIARLLGKVGLTPNALTLIGFGIAVVAAWFAAQQAWLVAGLLVAFGAVFDLFDGALARATNQTSRLGAFMDSTFDRAGEAVVYIGIAFGALVSRSELVVLAVVAAMATSFMVSYTRAKAEGLGFSSGAGLANVGLAPREVRLLILVVALMLAGSGPLELFIPAGSVCSDDCSLPAARPLLIGHLLITVLATITTIQRILFVYKQSKSQEVNE